MDIGTVLVCSLLVGLTLILFLWTLALGGGAPRWRLDSAWGGTSLVAGVGLLLTQGRVTPWISVILANALVVLGYHLLEQGLRRFADRPFRPWLLGAIAVGFLVPFVLFTVVWDLYQVRVVVYSVLVIGVWVRIPLVLRTLPEYRTRRALMRSFLALCLLILLAQTGRAVVALAASGGSVLGPSDALAVMLLTSVLVLVAWSLGFVTLDVFRNQGHLEAALETRDRMMQLIAHDLRGPLGGQIGLLELMHDNGQCRDESEVLDLLTRSAQTSFDLLENLLDWGQDQRGSLELVPEDVEVRELLPAAAAPTATSAQTKGIRVRLDWEPGARVRVDRRTVTAILRNLISNGVKFAPPGGEVVVSFRRSEDAAVFRVKDSGAGMPDEVLTRLNAGAVVPSTAGTLQETGSGLGLALCREFAHRNGGTLRFASTQGTEVTLTLP